MSAKKRPGGPWATRSEAEAEEAAAMEPPFDLPFSTMAGRSGTLKGAMSDWRLITVRHRIAELLEVPSYQLRLAHDTRAFSHHEDCRTLADLGLGPGAELSCVMVPLHFEEGDDYIQLSPATEYVPPRVQFDAHDNGGRPYELTINKTDGSVDVLVRADRSRLRFPGLGVFIGRWLKRKGMQMTRIDEPWGDGNSVLVQAPPAEGADTEVRTNIFIGQEIFSFETEGTDPILHYFSYIGNSNLPYPVALSDRRVYFMLDRVWVSRQAFGEIEPFADWETEAYQRPSSPWLKLRRSASTRLRCSCTSILLSGTRTTPRSLRTRTPSPSRSC